MNKPDRVESPIDKELTDRPKSGQLGPDKYRTRGFSIIPCMQRFRQLDWADRLNMILSAILACALVLVLSPLLLVSWIWMQLAKHGFAFRRPGHLRTDRSA
jgi:hypothetical protein